MGKPREKEERVNLDGMKTIIDQLEQLLIELKGLGGEMPVIEKNVKAMMSFIHVLKFGVSDVAEVAKSENFS
ncbi:MAG: hypothetical protein A2Y79_06800 [Deltaproteobacteria bacterium RBG_13_43_22]|nr:MAG: hypothetical protein A2Y79_06800 [Deltaproteobacteria bacterium RBG_13_43_22]